MRLETSMARLIAGVTLMVCMVAMARADDAPAGRMVEVATVWGTSFEGYLAGPADARLGVVLVHDRWGLNPQVRQWADRVAALGHRVLAVDLFDGRVARRPEDGLALWRGIDPVWTVANVDAALAFLRERQTHVVALGWGKGIGPLGDLARRSPASLSGMVLYYDADTTDEAGRLPPSPSMPVLDITVGRSLVHPAQDAGVLQGGADEAWQATRRFLARFGDSVASSSLSFAH
ncbi:MAG: dienelactone hydrolase family protein [Gammaproteobacteria bacterium]|jgi:carboxymethylenebutenolidase|nr:dienelactone hydrolase family protein [Gammaproteobacteria bacterium]